MVLSTGRYGSMAGSALTFAAVATTLALLTFLALAAYFVGWATAVFFVLLGVLLLPAFLPARSRRWRAEGAPAESTSST